MTLSDPVLGAILLNPPLTDGERTRRHLNAAAFSLGCSRVEIANLFPVPTHGFDGMAEAASTRGEWLSARSPLLDIVASDVLLAGWGMRVVSGPGAHLMRDQLDWLVGLLESQGRTIWTVGNGPRHPSRWHQYVSGKYGRAGEGHLHERLKRVLVERSPSDVI